MIAIRSLLFVYLNPYVTPAIAVVNLPGESCGKIFSFYPD